MLVGIKKHKGFEVYFVPQFSSCHSKLGSVFWHRADGQEIFKAFRVKHDPNAVMMSSKYCADTLGLMCLHLWLIFASSFNTSMINLISVSVSLYTFYSEFCR